MEFEKTRSEFERKENDIVYSKAIKAGKRFYYLDVKKSRNDDLFVSITESKKKVSGMDDNPQVIYEKHKIFLYKEDFDKFLEGMKEVIGFIRRERGRHLPHHPEGAEETCDAEDAETKRGGYFFDKFKF